MNINTKSLREIILNNTNDVNFNKFHKSPDFYQPYFEEYLSKDSKPFFDRIFNAYMRFKNLNIVGDFANSAPLYMNPIANILVNTFVKTKAGNEYSTSIISNVSQSKLEETSLKIRNILTKMFDLSNINVVFDTSSFGPEDNKNMKIYIDYLYKNHNDIDIDPLEYFKQNGCIRFKNSESIMITIIIPTVYIQDLMQKHLEIVSTTFNNLNSGYKPTEEDVAVLVSRSGSDAGTQIRSHYLKMRDFRDEFASSFLKVLISSLHRERYRESLYSQLFFIFNIMKNESGFEASNFRLSQSELEKKIKDKYSKKIESLFSRSKDKVLKPDLKESMELLKQCYLNPQSLYRHIFELPGYESAMLLAKLGLRYTMPSIDYTLFSSDLSDLNKVWYDNKYGELVATCILIKRLTPIIYYSEFVFNNGTYISHAKTVLDRFKSHSQRAGTYVNNAIIYTSLKEVIRNHTLDFSLLPHLKHNIVSDTIMANFNRCIIIED